MLHHKRDFYEGLPLDEECAGCHKKISNREWADNWAQCVDCLVTKMYETTRRVFQNKHHSEVQ